MVLWYLCLQNFSSQCHTCILKNDISLIKFYLINSHIKNAIGTDICPLTLSSAEVNNEWGYTFAPICLHGVDKENLAFYFLINHIISSISNI
jgi:hypothetical protein